MRWDEQRVEQDLRLPGVGDGTVVRTFDAPEAMGINFHEVRARSALNHVPGGASASTGRSTPTEVAPMPAFSASPAAPTPISTSTRAGTSSARSWSRSTCPELLRAELAKPSWKRELVALGTNTDPYQWVESRYRMMPEILAALEEAETPVSVLTKSPLVLRDVEIFERMAKRGLPVSVNLSVPTLDEKAWRATEPHTPSPAARLDAVAELRRRGIESGVLIAPLMPGINDTPEQVQPIVDRAREAGATFLGGVALHLRGEVPRRLLRLAGGKTPRPPAPIRTALRERPRLHAPLRPRPRRRSRSAAGDARGARASNQENSRPEEQKLSEASPATGPSLLRPQLRRFREQLPLRTPCSEPCRSC